MISIESRDYGRQLVLQYNRLILSEGLGQSINKEYIISSYTHIKSLFNEFNDLNWQLNKLKRKEILFRKFLNWWPGKISYNADGSY